MADQPGIVGPESFPIRDPRTKAMENGRILNPPRYVEFGGLDGPSDWFGNANTGAQTTDKNVIKLESGGPTGVKPAKKTSDYQLGG